jgi:hypothetical protein
MGHPPLSVAIRSYTFGAYGGALRSPRTSALPTIAAERRLRVAEPSTFAARRSMTGSKIVIGFELRTPALLLATRLTTRTGYGHLVDFCD